MEFCVFLFCKAHNTFYDVRAPCYVFPYFLALWKWLGGRRLPKLVPSGENVCCRIMHNRMTKKTKLANPSSRSKLLPRCLGWSREKNQEISIQLRSSVIHCIIESCQPNPSPQSWEENSFQVESFHFEVCRLIFIHFIFSKFEYNEGDRDWNDSAGHSRVDIERVLLTICWLHKFLSGNCSILQVARLHDLKNAAPLQFLNWKNFSEPDRQHQNPQQLSRLRISKTIIWTTLSFN